MKSLSLAKPLVILMVGLPGAGKSFFAEKFSETFGAPLISYDRLRMMLVAEPSYNKQEEEIINTVANSQLTELLKTKQTIVIDGAGASRVERMRLHKQAKQAGYDLLIVWVQTDEATARLRATKRTERRNTPGIPLSSEQYDSLTKQFTAPNHTEPYIVISGKHTYAAQVKVVLKKLAGPRQAASKTPSPPERDTSIRPRRQNITIR